MSKEMILLLLSCFNFFIGFWYFKGSFADVFCIASGVFLFGLFVLQALGK